MLRAFLVCVCVCVWGGGGQWGLMPRFNTYPHIHALFHVMHCRLKLFSPSSLTFLENPEKVEYLH